MAASSKPRRNSASSTTTGLSYTCAGVTASMRQRRRWRWARALSSIERSPAAAGSFQTLCAPILLFDPQVVQIADVRQETEGYSRLQDFILRLEKCIAPNVGVVEPVLFHAGGNFLRRAQI